MLSSYVPYSNGYYYNFAGIGSPGPCSWFAMKFYYYALYQGYSVHDSLDLASAEFFGCSYTNTVLYTGYQSWWPGGNWDYQYSPMPYMSDSGYYPNDFRTEAQQYGVTLGDANRMKIFGDSTIKLNQHQITFQARDADNNPTHVPSR